MKYFLSVILLSFCMNCLSAQEKHFVFIQSETKQPFYVSVNGKLYSSTATGYVIIPKLSDGNYNFTVGFAQNTFPEQTFSLAVQNKDLGFDLKNFNEKGWGLFNLQSLDITMASAGNSSVVAKALSESAKAEPSVISFEKKKDTTQLTPKSATDNPVANVAKDDAVKNAQIKVEPASSKDEKAATTSSPEVKSEGSVAKTDRPADVRKVSEVAGEDGVHLAYVEGSGKTKDTINIIIPSSPASAKTQSTESSAATSVSKSNTATSDQPNSNPSSPENKSDLKFLDISMSSKKDSVKSVETPKETTRIMENSNCKNIATDEDYAKLRKKMAMETTDDKMIAEARKFYRNKCFTTMQIKGLSTLFLSDEGRLKFFDASFVSVADAAQYPTLQTEFIDPAFVARFKALIQ